MNKLLEHIEKNPQPIKYFKKILPEPENYNTLSPGSYFYPDYYNAYICANISQLCYKSSVGAKHTNEVYKAAVYKTLEGWGWSSEDARKTIFINSREIHNEDGLSVPGTQGLVLFYEKTAFIAFRGSEKKLNDWLTNVNTRKVNSPYVPGNVHSGFLNAFEAILPDKGNKNDDKSKESNVEQKKDPFKDILEQLRSMEAIWLTGHSLGGAIASIGASYLLNHRFLESGIDIYIYTFGAPRVGDAEYRKFMNSKFTYRYWRFLHNHDIVPDVPFPGVFPFMARFLFIGFSRDGCMLRLKKGKDKEGKDKEEKEVLRLIYHDGKRKIFKPYNGITAKDHSIGAYCERLTDSNLPVMEYSGMLSNITLGTTEEEMNILQLQLDLSKLSKRFWLLLLLQLGLLGLVSWLILEKNSPTTVQPQPSAIINRK